VSSFPILPQNADQRRIVEAINTLQRGKMNAVTSLTLTANTTTTTLTDSRIGGGTYIDLSPTTADAAGAVASTYVSAKAKGSATITHANSVSTTRTFDVLLIG
jgi:hypothetical protein